MLKPFDPSTHRNEATSGQLLNARLVFTLILVMLSIAWIPSLYGQPLEWYVEPARIDLTRPEEVYQVMALPSGEMAFLSGSDRGKYLFQVNLGFRAIRKRLQLFDYPRISSVRTLTAQADSSGILILSDRGVGKLKDDDSFQTYFDDCYDSVYPIRRVYSEPNDGFTVLLDHEHKPVINNLKSRSYIERWNGDSCSPLWSAILDDQHGWVRDFFFDRRGELITIRDDGRYPADVLMRYANGEPITISGLPHPDYRLVLGVWKDEWGWTFLVRKTYFQNIIVRCNDQFQMRDTVALGMYSGNWKSQRRSGKYIIVCGTTSVVVVDVTTLATHTITLTKLNEDINDYGMDLRDADMDSKGKRLFIATTYGVHVYDMRTTSVANDSHPRNAQNANHASVVVDDLSELEGGRYFGPTTTQVSMYDVTGRAMGSLSVVDGHVKVTNETAVHRGMFILVDSSGSSLRVFVQ